MALTLDDLSGRVTDLDSHEQIAVGRYAEVFGERGRRFLELSGAGKGANPRYPVETGPDVMEITPKTVWEFKGPVAPGAADMDRRPEVLDMMGIRRQLVFTGFGLIPFSYAHGGGFAGQVESTPEQIEASLAALDAYNEWAVEVAKKHSDRLRMVGLLASGREGLTPEGLVAETRRMLNMGLPAIMIASGAPPAGVSPASAALDPFYALLAEADAPLIFHAGCGTGFRKSNEWERAPQFRYDAFDDEIPGQVAGQAEMNAGPHNITNVYLAEQNFLTVMVLGGVFERHPTLRVGCIEMGSSWFGPLAERMDFLTDEHRHHPWIGGKALSLRPSEYLARHVRVTPYVFEPVKAYVERYPELKDAYCYTTDYPHFEGNKWSMKRFYEQLAPAGDAFLEKFFCTNGELLLP